MLASSKGTEKAQFFMVTRLADTLTVPGMCRERRHHVRGISLKRDAARVHGWVEGMSLGVEWRRGTTFSTVKVDEGLILTRDHGTTWREASWRPSWATRYVRIAIPGRSTNRVFKSRQVGGRET